MQNPETNLATNPATNPAVKDMTETENGHNLAAPSALAIALAAYASSGTSSDSNSNDGDGDASQQQQSTNPQPEKRKTPNGTPAPRKRVRFAGDRRASQEDEDDDVGNSKGHDSVRDGASTSDSALMDGLDRPRRQAEAVYIPQLDFIDKSRQREESEADWTHLEDEREAHAQRELQARVARLRKQIMDARKTQKR